ncbi:MAG: DNA polymerase III subunit gamma/tau [Mycoplasmataceae bacterium]|nr:DNA polymerase III subunit gamma/tau [Mycoplasmataceae bacterium]
MSYKALYRTHRPNNFDEVVGQEHIVSTLENVIKGNKIGHAYLFSGPRGTGKTTVAHVFARAVNRTASGHEVFDEMDIIEIDAASNNGVAEVRTIIDNANYAPTKAKYKVYIIDEVHMLSKSAFNALLKTLEEPPEHVMFILATTEPHKIPITILSRTQRFNFKRIEDAVIIKQLIKVLDKEGITYDQESLKFIAKLAQGGMRDALSISDQSSAFGNGNITFEAVAQVFGVVSTSNQIKLFNFAYNGESRNLIKLSQQFINNGADIERISSSMIEIIKDYIVFSKTVDESLMTFINKEEFSEMKIDVEFAYRTSDILLELLKDIRYTPIPKQTFELAILKMVEKSNVKNIVVAEEVMAKTAEVEIKETIEDIFAAPEPVVKPVYAHPSPPVVESIPESSSMTDEIEMMNEEVQNDSEMSSIEEDILTTQEIDVASLQPTEEIDIMSMFNGTHVDKPKPVVEKKVQVSEIINLLVQASRENLESDKRGIEAIARSIFDGDSERYAKLFINAKIISSGKDFILLTAKDKIVVDGINSEKNNVLVAKFMNKLIKRNVAIFAITKEEFNIVKEEYMVLASSNGLPIAKEIKKLDIVDKEEKEQDDYGTSLFGDIFAS